jgi:hypothetical protein
MALKDPQSRAVSTEVPAAVAANHLDYQAIQELMGRDRRPPDPLNTFVFAAKRTKKGNNSTVTVFDPPDLADKLAVFTTAGPAAEIVDFPGGVDVDKSTGGGSGNVDLELSTVRNDQPIVRLELLREDGYPIRLGPRLGAV